MHALKKNRNSGAALARDTHTTRTVLSLPIAVWSVIACFRQTDSKEMKAPLSMLRFSLEQLNERSGLIATVDADTQALSVMPDRAAIVAR